MARSCDSCIVILFSLHTALTHPSTLSYWRRLLAVATAVCSEKRRRQPAPGEEGGAKKAFSTWTAGKWLWIAEPLEFTHKDRKTCLPLGRKSIVNLRGSMKFRDARIMYAVRVSSFSFRLTFFLIWIPWTSLIITPGVQSKKPTALSLVTAQPCKQPCISITSFTYDVLQSSGAKTKITWKRTKVQAVIVISLFCAIRG